jgi:hypothetical protein
VLKAKLGNGSRFPAVVLLGESKPPRSASVVVFRGHLLVIASDLEAVTASGAEHGRCGARSEFSNDGGSAALIAQHE